MARSAERIDDLLEEDAEFGGALAAVLEATDGGEEEVEWADVREEITSGHWGRLIETGILEEGEEGFRLASPDAVRTAIEDDPGVATPTVTSESESESGSKATDDDEGWSTYDKAAAGITVGLFAGYSIPQIRNTIGRALDVLLGPLDAVLPFYAVVLVLALLTGMYSTLLQANLMDMEKMGEYQQRMKDIQQRRKEAKERGDEEAVERIREEQMEAMGDQLGMFKVQFRPMVWIMLLTIPVFLWMYWMILEGHIQPLEQEIVVPLAGATEWRQGIVGPIQLWIVWYFVCSMAFTQLIRKALNIQTTPT